MLLKKFIWYNAFCSLEICQSVTVTATFTEAQYWLQEASYKAIVISGPRYHEMNKTIRSTHINNSNNRKITLNYISNEKWEDKIWCQSQCKNK